MIRSPRSARRSRARLAATGVLAALVLTGCGQGPVRAGAAATVGEQRIPLEQLTQVVDRSLADPEAAQQLGDRATAQRSVLSRLITSRLLAEAARREGVEVDEGAVAAVRARFREGIGSEEELVAQAADAGIAEQDLDGFFRDTATQEALVDALVAGERVPQSQLQALYEENIAQFDQVVARHILLETPQEAQEVLAQVRADPDSFGEVAAARSLDEGSKASGGQLPPTGRGGFVPEFENALFGAQEGEFGVVRTQFGVHVFQLIERRTTTLAEATPELRRQVLAEEREVAFGALLADVSADLGVRVNPRFGRWDPEQGGVVEAPSDLSTPDAGGQDQPLGELPPGEQPPGEQPPGEQPPGEQPPGEQPPVEQPPVEQPQG